MITIITRRLSNRPLLAAGMAAVLIGPALAGQIGQVLSSPLSAVVLAGQVSAGFADGPGTVAQFASITALDLGPQGWLYVADAGNHRIRLVNWAGRVTTLAGTGEDAQRDGPAREAAFHDLRLLSVDGLGNCYVLDGDQLRRVGADGSVTTLETIAIPSGYEPPQCECTIGGPTASTADTNYVIWSLVMSLQGQVYLGGRAGTSCGCCAGVATGCDYGNWQWSTSTCVFRGVGPSRETVANTNRTDAWTGLHMMGYIFSGSGAILGALARGLGEELLLYRASHEYHCCFCYNFCEYMPECPPNYDSRAYEVLVLGRTPEMSLTATNVTPAGMAALTSDSLLMQGDGKFYLLASGQPPALLESDCPPQIGLVVDRYGLIYSATTNQVLRFIPASTVVVTLRLQDPATGGSLLSVVSPPGRQVRVEQSRDFQQWEPRQTMTSTGQDSMEVKPESDRLFLRAVLLP